MTHTIVRRVALGICALCVSAAALFAYLASTAESRAQSTNAKSSSIDDKSKTHPGAALYDRYCAGCHDIESAVRLLKAGGPDLDANAKGMIDLLKRHGRSNDQEDRLIVEFIRTRVP